VFPLVRVPRTTSGKKRRAHLAARLAAGELDSLVGDTLRVVRRIWESALGLELGEADLDRSFTELGGGSIQAVDVLVRLEARYGLLPDHRLLLRGDTVRGMALLLERSPPRTRGAPPGRSQEPVAITGATCRLPGADDPSSFWHNVSAERCFIEAPPPGRWDGRGEGLQGAFLRGVDLFDAERFGMAGAEAAAMDPQQRLTLSLAADLIEPLGLMGQPVAVFVGAGQQSYLETVLEQLDSDLPPGTMAGNLLNMLAARVAHHLDLRGPALTVDTACSASLVAVHLACRSLAAGECEAALAGGVNLNLSPTAHRLFQAAGALSPSGRCLPFQPEADGTVPGEGAVMLLLEPLSRARARGAPLLAVIRGSAVNNDGASLGVMAPNPAGQQAVIQQALEQAGVDAAELCFVEAHGTGTPLGDPVEDGVLRRCYPHGPRRGAVKALVGHLLGAAGVTGLLRAIGELDPGELGAVSSFGFGGTNAHLVLEGGPGRAMSATPPSTPAGRRHWLGEPDPTGWVHQVGADPAGGLRWSPCPEGPSPLRAGGRFLITGGAGALGAQLARYLARRYGARMLLVGRSAMGAAQLALLREVEALGGAARYLAADVARGQSWREIRAAVDDWPGGVQALFHLAGGLEGPALAAKGAALPHLHSVEPELVVLFSSISAVLPGLDRGLEAYAQANAALDRWAREQHALGRRVLSIAWGPWSGDGLAGAHSEEFAARGITPVPPSMAMAAMERALGSGLPQVAVLRRLDSDLDAPPLPEDLEERLVSLVARAVQINPREVDLGQPLVQLGIDSVQAMELLKDLEQATGRDLPTTLLFENDTPRAILAALRRGAARDLPTREPSDPPALPDQTVPGDSWWPAQILPSQATFVVQRSFFPDIPGNVLLACSLRRDSGGQAIHKERLQRALRQLASRHPVLGTRFQRREDGWVQTRGGAAPTLAWVEQVDDRVEANLPFDLQRGPVLRAACDGQRLLLNAHHAAVDAWSLRNLMEELLQLHEASALEAPAPLRSHPVQAARALQRAPASEVMRWWRARLQLGVPPVDLPWQAPATAPASGPCDWVREVLPRDATAALAQRARAGAVSLPALVLAAYLRCLWRWSGQHRPTVRVAQGRREARLPDLDRLVGSFADSLPVSALVHPREPLLQLATRVQAELRQVQAHASASSAALAELVPRHAAGPVGTTPAGFSFPLLPSPETIGGLHLDEVEGASASGFTRLGLIAWIAGGRLHGSWNFLASHLSRPQVQEMARQHRELLLREALGQGQDPAAASLHGRILRRCAVHPEREAVQGCSYGTLAGRSARLAGELLAVRGAEDSADQPLVAVLARPGAQAVVALLGIMRSGAAYVPLDPSWPLARQQQVLDEARPAALVHTAELGPQARALAPQLPLLPVGLSEAADGPCLEGELAYVMFTSGSTGRPKGVMVRHQAVLAFQDWVQRVFGVSQQDRFVQTSSLAFGGSIRQIFAPLLAGATIHPASREVQRDPKQLLAFIREQGITIWNSVPSLWTHLLAAAERMDEDDPLPSLRWVLLGGEALPADPVRRWRARFGSSHRLANLYGSTETIVNATWHEIVADPAPNQLHTPIGWERSGVTVHLLDEREGVGELAVGGLVAEGYLRRPELTAASFVELPDLGRVYRTGDLARRAPDGALIFLGRRDSQVQVHGNRVELGEIEHTLCQHPLVAAAVVSLHEGRLECLAEAEITAEPGDLRAWLSQRLPAYMLPHRLRCVQRLPRTAAGKADRRAVASMQAEPLAPSPGPQDQDEIFQALAVACQRVLGLDSLPVASDDFFALGGDSILALELLERLRPQLPVLPSPLALYQHPGLADLARLLRRTLTSRTGTERARAAGPQQGVPHEVELSPVQLGFWLAHRRQPELAPAWCASVPVVGQLDPEAMQRALEWLVARHPLLRSSFHEQRGRPLQRIHHAMPPRLQWEDLSRLPKPHSSRALEQRWSEEALVHYHPQEGPLFRFRVCRLSRDLHQVLVGAHHMLADAWSAWLMLGELFAAHDAYRAGAAPALPPSPAAFHEIESWPPVPEHAAWWREALQDLQQDPAGGRATDMQRRLSLDPGAWDSLRHRARAQAASPFLVVLTAFFKALHRCLDSDDLLVSTALAGRDPSDARLARVVGPFARALPIRVRGTPELEGVRRALASAAAHDGAPPASIVAAAGADGLARLGRFFVSWMDPTAVPRPPSNLQPSFGEGRYRFATRSTDTEIMLAAVVENGLQLSLQGGPLIERLVPLLQRELDRLTAVDAALVVYAPPGVELPTREPLVVERVDCALASSQLVLAPLRAEQLEPGAELDGALGRALDLSPARVAALAGMLPALSGLASRPLGCASPHGDRRTLLTSGHAATVAAMQLTLELALEALDRRWSRLRVGVLGYGSIGRSVLALARHRLGEPAQLRIVDPRYEHGVPELGAVDLILGASSGGRTVVVQDLAAGTIVVDDSFPRAFDDAAARERMLQRRDVLLLSGGGLDAGPLVRSSPFPQAPALRRRYGDRWLPGCHAEAILLAARPSLGPTVGPVTLQRALHTLDLIGEVGWGAPPLHLGSWLVPEDLLRSLGSAGLGD